MAGLRTIVKDGYLKGGHELNFKPAKTCTFKKTQTGAAYEYMEQGPPKKKNYRNEDKEVMTEPKGFLTNPMKKGRTRSVVFENYEY